MAVKEVFFKPNHDILGGYYIPVRDNWNYHTIRRHLTKKEKELYEQQFGEKILSDDQYFEWWKSIQNEKNDHK